MTVCTVDLVGNLMTVRYASLIVTLVFLLQALSPSTAKENYVSYLLEQSSLTLPLSASFAQPPSSPLTVVDEREFPRISWADVKAVKAWADGRYLAFRIEFESPIPSYTSLYRCGVISFLIGLNNYTLTWAAIRHQAFASLKLNDELVNTKIYFKVEDDTVSLFLPLQALKFSTRTVSNVNVYSGGGYVIKTGIRLSNEVRDKSLSLKLNLLNVSEGALYLTYHGSYLNYTVLDSNADIAGNIYLTLALKQADSIIKHTTLLSDASKGIYISGLEENTPIEVPYAFLYLLDGLPTLNMGLSKVMVKVNNTDDNDLKLKLYIDGRLLKTDKVSAKSVKLMGTYLLSEGPHKVSIEWKDLDKEFESHEVIDVKGEITNVLLKTKFYKWRPPRCGCRGRG